MVFDMLMAGGSANFSGEDDWPLEYSMDADEIFDLLNQPNEADQDLLVGFGAISWGKFGSSFSFLMYGALWMEANLHYFLNFSESS